MSCKQLKRKIEFFTCRSWIWRQNPEQVMKINEHLVIFDDFSRLNQHLKPVTWCDLVTWSTTATVNSTWPWTKVSRWKLLGSCKMSSRSWKPPSWRPRSTGDQLFTYQWPVFLLDLSTNLPFPDLQQGAQEATLHIGPRGGDPATCQGFGDWWQVM